VPLHSYARFPTALREPLGDLYLPLNIHFISRTTTDAPNK